MSQTKRKLIFDTSAINGFADDEDGPTLLKALNIHYVPFVTATSIAESAADPDMEHRFRLVKVLRLLVSAGECMYPFQWIVDRHAREYSKDPGGYRTGKVDVRFPAAERALVGDFFLGDDVSEGIRKEDAEWGKEFEQIYRAERPAFDEIFAADEDKRPSFPEFCRHALRYRGPGWGVAISLFHKATSVEVDELTIKHFLDECPPVRAVLVALMWAHYKKCVAGRRSRSLGKAGRQDLMSAAYLPYCDVFVTRDSGQHNALIETAAEAQVRTEIKLLGSFKAALFGIG